MNSTLMKAILAMDSYNRSYNEGIKLTGDIVGNYTILKDSFDLGYIDPDASALVRKDEDIGFYAIAYQDNSTGQVTISYRGTDQFLTDGGIGGDIPNSYDVGGLGDADGPQARMAFEFYKSVAAALNPGNPDPYAANIFVTGHSMGGGLAGLVGAVYHKAANDNRLATRPCAMTHAA